MPRDEHNGAALALDLDRPLINKKEINLEEDIKPKLVG